MTCRAIIVFLSVSLFATSAWGKPDHQAWTVVQQAMRAGFQRHDLKQYLAAWHSSAVLIGGRSAKSGPFDYTLTYKQVVETKRLRFGGKPPKRITLTLTLKRLVTEGKVIVIESESVISGSGYSERVGERYRLKSFNGKFLIVKNRFWPIATVDNGRKITYDAGYWKKADDAAKALPKGAYARRVHQLGTGWRFADAFKVAQEWSKKAPKNIQAWSAVGQFGVITGQITAAIAAYRMVYKLNKKQWMPDYVRKIVAP